MKSLAWLSRSFRIAMAAQIERPVDRGLDRGVVHNLQSAWGTTDTRLLMELV
jgi:hypothetical protein